MPYSVNDPKLAEQLLQWRKLRQEMDGLEYAIKEHILAVEKTVTVGGVRAMYTKGRTTYNYRGAVQDALNRTNGGQVEAAVLRAYTFPNLKDSVITEIAKKFGLEAEATVGQPFVSLSLLDDTE